MSPRPTTAQPRVALVGPRYTSIGATRLWRCQMTRRPIGIIVNGVTGRMGYHQHLVRSLLAIRDDGGLPVSGGDRLWPEPILVGRNEARLGEIAARHGLTDWTTDLAGALARPDAEIYFDAQVTAQREKAVRQAIEAGKHVYVEKPLAGDSTSAAGLARAAAQAGVCNGVVADKLFLPGLRKLKRLVDAGFFGRILSVRGEFGYWVFEGDWQAAQRPSWNYRAQDGGGITLDMFPHWQYVLEGLFAPIRTVQCTVATHIPTRVDEAGNPYQATADDAAYATLELAGGIVVAINSSWCARVNRDELVEFQVDGTHGSAVAGLRECRIQHRVVTPRPTWNPDVPSELDFRAQWQPVPDNDDFDNGFKVQWEAFLRHVVDGAAFPWDFAAATRGVRLAELALQSARDGCRLDMP
jgi:predicted dehydrogenase